MGIKRVSIDCRQMIVKERKLDGWKIEVGHIGGLLTYKESQRLHNSLWDFINNSNDIQGNSWYKDEIIYEFQAFI